MARYDNSYDPDTSYGAAVRLVQQAGLAGGIVLDLGCGYGAVAEPLVELGFEYVGVDIDPVAVAAVAERGLTAATLDLAATPEALGEQLRSVLGGRAPAVVLALDSLEHLPRPEGVLRVLRDLGPAAGSISLVVSYPNVTHYDVAANLVAGRWYQTTEGLLDRTHLQFRDERGLTAMLGTTGWHQVDADDVVRDHSDQAVPSDSPFLRPGAPVRELLWSLRGGSAPAATVFQFVRRYVAGAVEDLAVEIVTDESREVVAALVLEGPGDAAATALTVADLAAQRLPVGSVEVVTGDLAPAVARQGARWIAVLHAGTRLAADWSQVIQAIGEEHPGKVLRVGTIALDPTRLADLGPAPLDLSVVVDASVTVELDPFDPITGAPRTPFVSGAYAIPYEVVASAGLTVGSAAPLGAELPIWIARAAQASGLVGTDIVVLAVPERLVHTPDPVAPFVVRALDERPIVLPAGSASKLVALHRRAEDAERLAHQRSLAAIEAEEVARRLADQLHRLDHDLAAERIELSRLRGEHARRLSRRVARRLRRLR